MTCAVLQGRSRRETTAQGQEHPQHCPEGQLTAQMRENSATSLRNTAPKVHSPVDTWCGSIHHMRTPETLCRTLSMLTPAVHFDGTGTVSEGAHTGQRPSEMTITHHATTRPSGCTEKTEFRHMIVAKKEKRPTEEKATIRWFFSAIRVTCASMSTELNGSSDNIHVKAFIQ